MDPVQTLPYPLIGTHDDFILKFERGHKNEFITWSSTTFNFDASFAHIYWWCSLQPSSLPGFGTMLAHAGSAIHLG